MTVLRFSELCATGAVRNQRVFIRADFNIPLTEDGEISDATRVASSVPCIRMALDAGAAVMVTSHLGRPTEGQPRPQDSLAPVARLLRELLGCAVPLLEDWVDGVDVAPGEVVLLQNCRLNVGEKANDEALARRMAALCDIYVNDAFGAAHRSEASIVGIARHAPVACAGPLLADEIDAIEHVIRAPRRPLVAIVGGSKVSTKLTVLESLATKVDELIVGGGMANTFMLAAGLPIGRSLAEPQLVPAAQAVMRRMAARGAEVPLPEDVVTAKALRADAVAEIKSVHEVAADDLILDLGPVTARRLADRIAEAATIVWNGPVGVFEWDAFGQGTETIARAIAASRGFSIAGGGDTLAAVVKYGLTERIDYISTGGGAFLEMLEGRKLPAIAILEQRSQTPGTTHAGLSRTAA